MATLLKLISKFDSNIQIRGSQFEHICKWYLENDPKYRLELKKVWLWKDWPGRWGPDCGIDLIGKDYDGKVWAIQAKAYADQYSIKKADIDSFLSESSRPEISFRLLIATTNLIGKTAQRTIESQEKKVGLILLSNLAKSEIEWPDSPDELFAKPVKPKTPRPHQVKAIDDVCGGFSENDRGQLIMACGTGKTLASLWIAEKLECQRTLILLPSLSLLAQTLKEWVMNTSQEFHYLPVCSDDTVRGEDHFTSYTSELGLPVTTDPAEVAAFLRRKTNLVVFSTYQSSPVIAKAFAEYSVPGFDLIIADEAHRCAGPVSGMFSTVIEENVIKSKRRLFMTATPRYFTDKAHKEAKELEYEIASMDDEEKFGPCFHRLSFSEAIGKDLLSDYQVVIVGVDNSTYKKYAEYETIVTTNGKDVTDAKTLASQIALIKAMRTYDLKRVITFHGRIKRAKMFSDKFPDVVEWMPEELRPEGVIWTSHVSGEMSSGQRTMRLDRLRYLEDGERGLLSNARCLGEGVDVPTLDGVAFIDPRHSQIDIVQAVGRAIRKAPDKKMGIIVLPVFINDSQDGESALESSAFKPIWDVLKALRAHDDVLATELDILRRQLGPNNDGKISLPDKLVIKLPVTVGDPFAEAFKIKLVKKTSSSWGFWYAILERFVKKNYLIDMPSIFLTDEGYNLGSWTTRQRSLYKKGSLPKDRHLALEKVPGWFWDKHSERWDQDFKYLQKFAEREGHADVPNHHMEDGFTLAWWVKRQRYLYKRGLLSRDRQLALEKLPGWFWDKLTKQWHQDFKYLQVFAEREGHTDIPTKHIEDSFALGKWVEEQRYFYKRRVLAKDRQLALEKLPGWFWAKFNKQWHQEFKYLQLFAEREGHTDVPTKHIEDGFALGQWVARQRNFYKKGLPPRDYRLATNKLPGWIWDKYTEKWCQNLKCLKKFAKREGHTDVATKHIEDGFNLRNWVTIQQKLYKEGSLAIERVVELEQIPGWFWDKLTERWRQEFKYLQKFAEREGHADVPNYHMEDGFTLDWWVKKQQNLYKSGSLPKDRIVKLEQIPGWSWDNKRASILHDEKWLGNLKLLYKFAKREGHTDVPYGHKEDGLGLGTWVAGQRNLYKKGSLAKKRIVKLEQMPEWSWDSRTPTQWLRYRGDIEQWQQFFKFLQEFVGREGHTDVPYDHIEDGFALGKWVTRQRILYKKKSLPKDRIVKLEQMPEFSWENNRTKSNDERWLEDFKYLCKFAEREGHTDVPDGFAKWVTRQRSLYKKGSLPKDRQLALEKLPGWFWKRRSKKYSEHWHQSFKRLQEFAKREGHTEMPYEHIEDGFALAEWVAKQRNLYKSGSLPKDRQLALEKLPEWIWDRRTEQWYKNFRSLQKFVKREGHTDVSIKHVEDGLALGMWVARQRNLYKNGLLAEDRRHALEDIPELTWKNSGGGPSD